MHYRASQEALVVKRLPTKAGDLRERCRFDPLEENPLEEGMATHSSILAWKSYGQRSPGVYGPKCCKQSDMTEVT